MKTKVYLLLTFVALLILSCNKNNNEEIQPTYNAKVLYKGQDCGENFLIKFNSNATNVPANTTDSIFYGINLPSQYQINNLDINIDFREPTNNELLVCTHQGISFPQIYIIRVNN